MLLFRPPRTRQPQEIARAAPGWAAVYAGSTLVDHVGSMPRMAGGPAQSPTSAGVGPLFSTSTSGATTGQLVPGISDALTVLMVAEPRSVAAPSAFMFAEAATGFGAYNYGLYESNSGVVTAFVNAGGSGTAAISSVTWGNSVRPQVWVMTYGGGDDNIRLYQDGVEVASAAKTGAIQRDTSAHLGINRWSSPWNANYVFLAGAVAARRLTAAEIRSRFRDPGNAYAALFAPAERRIWVPSTAAATTRGRPFGMRSNAFNGGRTLTGVFDA